MLREVRPTRVIEDSAKGLFVWLPVGTETKSTVTIDNKHPRRLAELLGAQLYLVDSQWRESNILQWFPLNGEAYSIWWFFKEGRFVGWYVNLEDPAVRWLAGIDTSDHALDIWVEPNRSWHLKDQDEFEERIGHPWFWTKQEAQNIRLQADRVIDLIESATFPFDGSWCHFHPGHDWPIPELPMSWNMPRAKC